MILNHDDKMVMARVIKTGKPKSWDEPTTPPYPTLIMKLEGFHQISQSVILNHDDKDGDGEGD